MTDTPNTSGEPLSYLTTGDGVRIAYRQDGGPEAPVLVLANSIGTNLQMWRRQIAELSRDFRVLRYDYRGHGASDVPPGAYSNDRLGCDVVELLDHLAIERAHFLSLSLGGYVGQWLGVHAPERIDRLILCHTAAWLGSAEIWDRAIAEVLAAPDMTETAATFLANWFPAAFFASSPLLIDEFRDMLLTTSRAGLAGCWAVVRDADGRRTASLIEAPTLVIAGRFDTVTSVEHGEALAASIPDARLAILPAVHLSNVETPVAFLAEVLDFLHQGRGPAEREARWANFKAG